jgi:ATP-dependent DNA helicase RecQ
VSREEDKLDRTLALVAGIPGSGIVYAATVKAATLVHDTLAQAGQSVGLYHGRMAAGRRIAVQEGFMEGRLRVMVATNAFGLGIDKPDLRFVLHYQMPARLDAYYQESGRAGRDGGAAQCTLLYLRADKAVQQFFLAGRYPALNDLLALYHVLHASPPDGGAWTVDSLATSLESPDSKLKVALHLLRHQRIVAQDRAGRLRLLRRDLGPAAVQALAATYQERRDEDQAMLEQMVFYAQTGACRWRLLLEHLGATPEGFTRCDSCDNCRRMAAAGQADSAATAADAAPIVVDLAKSSPLKPGQPVRVKRYGRGRVASCDASSVTVEFANGETRCFVRDYVTPVRGRKQDRAPTQPGGTQAQPAMPVHLTSA